MMRALRWTCPLAVLSVLVAASAPARAHEPAARPSLYQRLGGYDALAAVVDDFIGRMLSDPALAPFFAGHGTESKLRIRQLVVDQLCAATGGPCVYLGRDMKATHAGLGITEAQWNAGVAHLSATLDKFKVGHGERGEVLAAIGSLKGDIVESPR
jgi:hemoglobin